MSNRNKCCIEIFFSRSSSLYIGKVEPKQVLYWNILLALIGGYKAIVEPKQVLYWNFLSVNLAASIDFCRTETSVVLKFLLEVFFYKHLKSSNRNKCCIEILHFWRWPHLYFYVEPKQVLYWNFLQSLKFSSIIFVEPKQVLYWNPHQKFNKGFLWGRTETSVVLKYTCLFFPSRQILSRTETSVVLKFLSYCNIFCVIFSRTETSVVLKWHLIFVIA